jgi:hypothetical protein
VSAVLETASIHVPARNTSSVVPPAEGVSVFVNLQRFSKTSVLIEITATDLVFLFFHLYQLDLFCVRFSPVLVFY